MDNLTIDGRFIKFRLHENANSVFDQGTGAAGNIAGGVQEKDVGNEIDIEMNYEYTEDVTFGLLTAWFWSGDAYAVPEHVDETFPPAPGTAILKAKDVASEVVASCKVSF